MSRRREHAVQACHTRWKRKYTRRAAAASDAAFLAPLFGHTTYPYRCTCGLWHLTTHPRSATA